MGKETLTRREFLKLAALAAGGAVLFERYTPLQTPLQKERIGRDLFFLPVDLGEEVSPEITQEYQTYMQNQGWEIDWQALAMQSLIVAAIANPDQVKYSLFAYRLQENGVLVRHQEADVVKESNYQESDGWTPDQQIGQALFFSWFKSEASKIIWPNSSVYPLPFDLAEKQRSSKEHLYALVGLTAVGEPKRLIQVWQRVRGDKLPQF